VSNSAQYEGSFIFTIFLSFFFHNFFPSFFLSQKDEGVIFIDVYEMGSEKAVSQQKYFAQKNCIKIPQSSPTKNIQKEEFFETKEFLLPSKTPMLIITQVF
jgi:hypothetical protein